MRGFKSPFQIVLTDQERGKLEEWLRCHSLSQNLATRARIILLSSTGVNISALGLQLGIDRKTARKWIKRFCENRIDGLYDKERSGRPPVFFPL